MDREAVSIGLSRCFWSKCSSRFQLEFARRVYLGVLCDCQKPDRTLDCVFSGRVNQK